MIEIVAKKVMRRGEPKVLVKGVKALKRVDLPVQYLDKPPYLYMTANRKLVTMALMLVDEDYNTHWISKGSLYSPEEFQELVSLAARCGERLHRINQEIKEKARKWGAGQTIVIRI